MQPHTVRGFITVDHIQYNCVRSDLKLNVNKFILVGFSLIYSLADVSRETYSAQCFP